MNKEKRNVIDKIISESERIGTIGSPSSTGILTLDILGTAVSKKLVGELAFFHFLQEGQPHYSLGQVTEIQLRNVWLEDPTMRSLARQRGQVAPVSGLQDTHQGNISISAVFCDAEKGFVPGILGTVPPTGTYIHLASDQLLDTLLARYKDELFYLGHVFGSKPRLPLWFKHFDSGKNGAGEAYHIGIFGKTGSGKSVLAKMILLAYARHPEMAIFIMDPQGEFSKDLLNQGSQAGFSLPLGKLLKQSGRKLHLLGIKDLVLDSWELFSYILAQSGFFKRLSILTTDKAELASEVLTENLKSRGILLKELHTRKSFEEAIEILKDQKVTQQIYAGARERQRIAGMMDQVSKDEQYNKFWLPVCRLFQTNRPGAKGINSLLNYVFSNPAKPVTIINLSKRDTQDLFWNEKIQALIVKRLLAGIEFFAERNYQENKSLNSLVIMDEAHKFAPRERIEDNDELKDVCSTLLNAVRTTRKYGLGWMFISQTLSSLHREIINQLRIKFFGFGLSLGSEFQALHEIVGGDPHAMKLYQSFRDPHSSFDMESRQYAFMTVGPVSPLSFAGTPLFLTAFNTPQEFYKVNNFTPV